MTRWPSSKLTDNVSGFVAEAVARQLRHQLLDDDPRPYQEEHGEFVSASPAPDTIRERLEALRSLSGGASHDDVIAETRWIRES
ncbi:hypothetical protein ACFQE7_42235 [Nonomuraea ferruginea]|uniref:hypothetical protein n=1 Tax=Nonomuraea ferruginea TaxID=46174 RepID=UPI0036105B89